jgi:hypothetical protein
VGGGARVGLGVVGDAGRGGGRFVGEAVEGVGVDDELIVGAGGSHFFGEGGDVRHGDVRVEGPVADEDAGADLRLRGWLGSCGWRSRP